ncbi:NADH-quinone oxidoreductase subunit A [Acidilobus saccharovorans 345-15]|uniref:NADH-quinone oxidoreductase subunit A n=1 Tax=Acidilobus saccharovorans (strain DSM 16705 / JCM 18335 / VKM B-2471 / 345-15) TaxID=666510 RepID=D9Q0F2_ACIS3|nr:NADH-quinone oxidoreductase subunit A [Acidilobus saccharovorans 345-15]
MLAANSFIIVPTIILAVLVGTILLLRMLLRPAGYIESKEPYKYRLFESSNPPRGVGKSRLSYQYFGYLIMFLAVEPAVVLLTFLASAPSEYSRDLLLLYLVMVAVFAPLLAYGAYVSRRIEEWRD